MAEDSTYRDLAKDIELDILRGVALGGRRGSEVDLLISSQEIGKPDFAVLALELANVNVTEDEAARTFHALSLHQAQVSEVLGRDVGARVAALDLLENIERESQLDGLTDAPSYWELERMAFRDPLTGLDNFRSFSARLEQELRRAKRYRHQLSLVMMDLDHFKAFNDTHGHPAGNVALKHFSKVLESSVRETDAAARYGGEEFAVILPETGKRVAQDMAERLRQNLATAPVELEAGGHHRITLSLGVATFPRDAWAQEHLIKAADEALYRAKQTGRNRVSLYHPGDAGIFRFRPEPGQMVERCAVVGSFNGWDPQSDRMHPQEDGSFFAKVGLVPGSYEYKYVLNGREWMADPSATESISDGYWGHNSVVHVKKT